MAYMKFLSLSPMNGILEKIGGLLIKYNNIYKNS